MKSILLVCVLATVVFLGACSRDAGINDPAAPNGTSHIETQAPPVDGSVTAVGNDRVIEARVTLQLEQMTRILGLTDRQQAAVKQILLDQYKTMMEYQRKYAKDPEGLRKALQTLQARVDNQIMSLLTRDQLAKWKRWKAAGSIGTRNG